MHQTFYIDADEEISSVIDKLNKSVSAESYFVVPKRALFLQSIVNLKLLKRESDKLGKHLVIVTQDEIGASMAQRSGLDVKHTIEGMETSEIEAVFHSDESTEELDFYDSAVDIEKPQDNKKNRLSAVGSNDFYDLAESVNKGGKVASTVKAQAKKIPINGVVTKIKEEKHIGRKVIHPQTGGMAQSRPSTLGHQHGSGIDPAKERTLEKMFSSVKTPSNEKAESLPGANGTAKKIFIGFIALCFVAFAVVATYLFLPSAKITVTPQTTIEKVDLVAYGNSENSQVSDFNMPVRVIDKEDRISLSYDVVGGGVGAGKKAHGTVVIYNEYDSSPQILIATTRLESADGKTFRLVKNVSVPGTTNVGNETKPGAIEAEVTADQSGSDFNIAPSSFTVPGFKGGPKYAKFHAKSTESFVGGSSEGGSAPGVVTQKDIDDAKQKTEKALKDKIRQSIADDLKSGEVFLEQNEKISIVKTGTVARVGDMTSAFNYDVVISIRTLVFSESDVRTIIEKSIGDKWNPRKSNWNISKIEYGTSVADFDKNTLELKIHSEISSTPIIDIEKIKGEVLGKKDDQLGVALKDYAYIKAVNVEFQPTIVSRVPQYASRVSVEIGVEDK